MNDPLATMNSFNKQFGLNNDEKKALAWAWPYEIGDTMFCAVNAYTRAAQREGPTAESSHRLQKIGGNILAMLICAGKAY